MQVAVRGVFTVFHELRVRVCVDDMKLFLKGESFDLLEKTRRLYELLNKEMDKVHLEISVI